MIAFTYAGTAFGQTITIVDDIANTTCYETKPVAFTINATTTDGTLKYLWKVNRDDGNGFVNAGSAGKTLNLVPNMSYNGFKYKCILSDKSSTRESSVATLTVEGIARITAQPKSPSGLFDGQNATLSVTATGANLSYQWEFYNKTTRKWEQIAGATTTTYTIPTVQATQNGTQYRCIVSNSGSTATSAAASLVVNKTVQITRQPVNLDKKSGETATFSITATGSATIKYQWYMADDATSAGTAMDGKIYASLSIPALTKSYDEKYFYCVATNGGGTATSDRAYLTVFQKTEAKPVVTSLLMFKDGDNVVKVNAKAEGSIAYQWEIYDPKTRKWGNATGPDASGVVAGNEAELSYAISASTFVVGTIYRCKVWSDAVADSVPVTSALIYVTLCDRTTVSFTPNVHLPQAFAKNEIMGLGNQYYQAVFSVTAKGTWLTYEWQSSTNGTTWTKATVGTGITSTRYVTPILLEAADFNTKYRCAVINTAGTVYSDVITVKKLQPAAVASGPVDAVGSPTTVTTFTVNPTDLSGDPAKLTYYWEISRNGGTTWTSAGGTGRTLTVYRPSVVLSGALYRCSVSNAANTKNAVNAKYGRVPAISSSATLEVKAPAVIAVHPKADMTYKGGAASYEVKAYGYKLNYQWQYSADGGRKWININAATTSTLDISTTNDDYKTGTLFRCRVWSSDVQDWDSATNTIGGYLTVHPAAKIVKVESKQAGVTTDCNKFYQELPLYVDNAYPLEIKVTATGYGLKYQWYSSLPSYYDADGTPHFDIPGATSSVYRITDFSNYDPLRDEYWCEITNVLGEHLYSNHYGRTIYILTSTIPQNITGLEFSVDMQYTDSPQTTAPVKTMPLKFMTLSTTDCRIIDTDYPSIDSKGNSAFITSSRYSYSRTGPLEAKLAYSFKDGKGLAYSVSGTLTLSDGALTFKAKTTHKSIVYPAKADEYYTVPLSMVAKGYSLTLEDLAGKTLNLEPPNSIGGKMYYQLLRIRLDANRTCGVVGWEWGNGLSVFSTTGVCTYSQKGPDIGVYSISFVSDIAPVRITELVFSFDELTGPDRDGNIRYSGNYRMKVQGTGFTDHCGTIYYTTSSQ